jgi:endonuclease/exonuclease/phosphatase family metal-dependent hydrolase
VTEFIYGSYNLERGGIDNGDDRRLRRQLAMLAEVGADGWAIQECKHWADDDSALLHLAEEQLGMTAYLAKSAHHGCHLAVFIRARAGLQVIEPRHESGHPYWHAVARVVIRAEELPRPLHLVSAHLAPSSPSLRLIEAESLALIAKDGLVIAGGDWNAAPAADPDPPAAGIDAGHARRKLERSAARAIEEAGFTDVAGHLGNHAPTVGHTCADKLAYRCDRIYTTLPGAAITGYQVITEDQPASDHRPVLATFDLTSTASSPAQAVRS